MILPQGPEFKTASAEYNCNKFGQQSFTLIFVACAPNRFESCGVGAFFFCLAAGGAARDWSRH
jgi:hypothetical protein